MTKNRSQRLTFGETEEIGTSDNPAKIYPLLADEGNKRLLINWIEGHTEYSVISPDVELSKADFDLCILDVEAFQAYADELERQKKRCEPIQLPYLLLLSEKDRTLLENDRRNLIDNVVWRNVDEIIELPLGQTELYWRVESLLRIRAQSIELADREGRYRSIVQDVLNSVDIGLVLFDSEDRVAWGNDAAGSIFKFETEEILELSVDALFDEYIQPVVSGPKQFEDRYVTTFALDESVGVPDFQIKDKSDRWFTGRSDPITVGTLAGGRIHQYWEVTRQKESKQQLSIVDRVLRHNLRNELTVIRGRAEEIQTAVSGDPSTQAQQIIEDCNSLLDTAEKSRNITNLLSVDSTPVQISVGPIISDAVDKIVERYPNAEINTKLNSPGVVHALPELQDAIEELLVNAIVHAGEDTPKVSVTVEKNKNTTEITVEDNGPGLPAMDQTVLQSGEEVDDLYHGSGLGMWLVHLIVRRSRGTVTVTTVDESGTTITISLPRDPDTDARF